MLHFTGSPLNINLIRESYQVELLNLIDSNPSPKAIYWEKDLLARLSSVVSHSVLKEHGVVNSFLIQSSKDSIIPPHCKSVIFIFTPKVSVVDVIQAFVSRDSGAREYSLIAVPRLSFACKNFLKEKKILDKFHLVSELPVTIIPVENDVLSMEDSNCFANYCVSERQDGVYQFVQGLMRFQSIFGLFPRIRAKGCMGLEVAKMLQRMQNETMNLEKQPGSMKSLNEIESQTEMLIVIDRSIDPLTPLLHQLTYAGLIDEIWGIRFGICHPFTTVSSDEATRVVLNSSDTIFSEIRDQNFVCVGSILSQRSKEISSLYEESKSAKEISDLRRVVNQLPEMRMKRSALEIHTSMAEKIQKKVNSDEFWSSLSAQNDFLYGFETDKAHPFIEDCTLRVAPLDEVLRLICIQSFCNGGLKKRLLFYYKSEILQVYGFEHIYTLEQLERIGLIYETGTSNIPISSFPSGNSPISRTPSTPKQTILAVSNSFGCTLKKSLRLLIPPNSENTADTDHHLSNVFSGYIPITTRLVQLWTSKWPSKAYSIAGTQNVSGTSKSLSKATHVLLSGARMVSGFMSDDSMEMSSLSESDGLTNRKIQNLFSNHSNFTEPSQLSTLIPGQELDEMQSPTIGNDEMSLSVTAGFDFNHPNKSRVVVVAFIGGVTQAEISTLRALSAADETNVEFVIITTGFLTAKTFLDSISEPIQSASLIPF